MKAHGSYIKSFSQVGSFNRHEFMKDEETTSVTNVIKKIAEKGTFTKYIITVHKNNEISKVPIETFGLNRNINVFF